ncbi:tail fiber domain-containing protein [Floridanema aerugineum]|uniref:Tail fiber domain-containing protein n=1 Tax=Floridaenema aerugineum BLCC-F46 TaxID=3153654 RepID=A0ABV4WZE5_9CYAN
MAEQNFDNLRVTQQTYIGTGGDSDAQLHIWRNDNQEAKILLERAGSILLKLAVNSENVATLGTIGNSPLQLQAAGTSGIYLNTNGLVGVGTTTPSFNLDVQGIINATQFYKNGQRWKITNDDIDDNKISGLKIQDNSIPIGKLKDFSPSPGSQWKDGSSGSGSIFYDGSGNVGIGIGKTNPTFKLDVQGVINATQFNKNGQPWKITNDDIDDNAAIDGNKMKDGSIPIKKIKDLPPSTSSQWVSGNSGIISYSGGNVGIGISNPQFKLDVQGNINATQFFKNGVPWIISRDEIANQAINADKIGNGAVTTDKIANKSITQEKLAFQISPPSSSQWQGVDGDPISYTKNNVGIGTTTPKSLLEIRKDVSNKLGAVLTLQNSLGGTGAGVAIDFNGYDVGQDDPTARIQSLDDGSASSHIAFYTKQSGAPTNKLQERLRIQSNGNIGIGKNNPAFNLDVQGIINATQFYKNGVPWIISRDEIASQAINADKIGNGAVTTDKIANKSITQEKLAFQISPPSSSQWQGVDGAPISYTKNNVGIGTTTPLAKLQVANGAIMPSAGNSETSGIMFPKDPGGGGDDAAWIRYYARTDEACTLEIGISNDGDDHIALMPSGYVGIGTKTPSGKLHIYEPTDDKGQGGSIKFFDTGANWKYEISYDGGSDGKFMFTNTGKAEGETGFQSSVANKTLLTMKNNGQVEVPNGNLSVKFDLYVGGQLVQASSRELKENITDFSTQEAIKTLAGLNPVKFNYREDPEKGLTVGFIAEDVPDLLATHEKKGVCALEIVAVLTKVIKEQQMELSLLRERVTTLEAKA